ncbi:MAG: hypothetical protein Q7R70_02675 [Candidatus Diapherotrites archaeon]|nr:hypothetical protein [Candidatus Diapherotrites archaeon]
MHSELRKLALKAKDALRPFGELDCLMYYATVSEVLRDFLKGKELASKIYIPQGLELLKRGSQLEPLFAFELAANVNEDFLRETRKLHLNEARGKISKKQEKIWKYFYPRKNCTFLYATNTEGINHQIERVFFDIDRKSQGPEDARLIASELAGLIQADSDFKKKIGKFDLMPMWTGSSFHVYLLLEKPITHGFYDKELMFSKSRPLNSFTGKWAQEIAKATGLKVIGGHEKQEGFINIDPSQTPSGKLARAPFSLHFKDAKTLDGIALPLTFKQLGTKGISRELRKETPEKAIKELDFRAKAIP